MSETATGPQTGEEKKTEGKIVSAGQPSIAVLNNPTVLAESSTAQETAEEKATREAKELEDKNKLPEFTDDQLKEVLKGKGIELDDKGFEGLKEKLKPAAAASTELTDEQKLAAEQLMEKRMLDKFIEKGGTAENFVAFKQIAGMDLTVLSENQLKTKMKEEGFDDDEVNEMLKERFYQIKLDELTQGEDEKTEDFEIRKKKLEKKIAYGAKEFGIAGSLIKKQAEDALSTLRQVITDEDLQKVEEVKNSERVTEFFEKLPRKVNFELGKTASGQDIPLIEFTIPEEVVTEVMDTLKDSGKRKQFLYNEDGGLNLDNVAKVMLENKYLKSALKESYTKGGKTQVEEFEKMFPGRTAKDIGVGGANAGGQNGRKGVIASAGKPEVAHIPQK